MHLDTELIYLNYWINISGWKWGSYWDFYKWTEIIDSMVNKWV